MSAQTTTTKKSKVAAKPSVSAAGVRVITAQDLAIETVTPLNEKAFATAVRVLRQNWRQGTVSVKDRSEVSFANRKPWRQKGTGRARAGSARSPLWRKGGVTFGPQPRTRVLSLATQVKRQVFRGLMHDYLKNGQIFGLTGSFSEKPSAKTAQQFLKDAGLLNKKIIMLVRPDDVVAQQSFANLATVKTLLFDQPNAFDLSSSRAWVMFDKDLQQFKDMVGKWD
jgi:large subunit ribosomal protein L4